MLLNPPCQIVDNAGVSADVVIANVLKGEGTYGYDAAEDTYGDMIEKGIIDPTKVTKTALLNASSIWDDYYLNVQNHCGY